MKQGKTADILVIDALRKELTEAYGKGYVKRNLFRVNNFKEKSLYLDFPL